MLGLVFVTQVITRMEVNVNFVMKISTVVMSARKITYAPPVQPIVLVHMIRHLEIPVIVKKVTPQVGMEILYFVMCAQMMSTVAIFA